MKKTLALSLIFILILTFSACNWNKDDSIEETISALNYKAGQWKDNVYSSEFLNTTITAPKTWTISSNEDLKAEKQTIITDSMSETDAPQEDIERGIEYELKLTNDISHSYMNIVLKDMDIIYSMAYSEEDAMNMFQKNMQQLNSNDLYIASMSEPKWVTLGDNKYYMCELEYDFNQSTKNASHYQRIYLRKIGTYMTNLTMSAVDYIEFEEMEGMFSEYIAE